MPTVLPVRPWIPSCSMLRSCKYYYKAIAPSQQCRRTLVVPSGPRPNNSPPSSFPSSSSSSSASGSTSSTFTTEMDNLASKITTSSSSILSNLVQSHENPQPHHLHIYSTKHNTHLTFTRPNCDPIFSFSVGNIGFRKAGRGSYDAAYQLAAYTLNRIQEGGHQAAIDSLEIVFRGFGPGREAVTKALVGTEGRFIRAKISAVRDATRLKFGGARSSKPRRL